MFKRIASALLCLLLLMVSLMSSAAATDPVGAFDFTVIFMNRIAMYNAASETDIEISALQTEQKLPHGEWTVHIGRTMLTMNPDDLSVREAWLSIVDLESSNEKNDMFFLESLIAFSALEFSESDELLLSIQGKTWFSKTMDIWKESILPKVSKAVSNAKSGERQFIYSGNYNYYLYVWNTSSFNRGDDVKHYVDLIAISK